MDLRSFACFWREVLNKAMPEDVSRCVCGLVRYSCSAACLLPWLSRREAKFLLISSVGLSLSSSSLYILYQGFPGPAHSMVLSDSSVVVPAISHLRAAGVFQPLPPQGCFISTSNNLPLESLFRALRHFLPPSFSAGAHSVTHKSN